MGQIVYRFDGSTLSFLASPFTDVLGEEICSGELGARSSGEPGDVTLVRGAKLPVPILAFRSRITTTMRRTHRQVREEGKHFYIVWLVEKGQVSVSGPNGTKTVPSNTIMITNSSDASYTEALIGSDREHRNKLALVPAHLLHPFVPQYGPLNTMSFPVVSEDGKIVASLINLLFETGDTLEQADAALALELLLRALGRLVGAEADEASERRSMQQSRVAQIKAHIDLHMANPRLSLAEVARMCGISPRYLAQVMRASGTSFATTLRERRLEEARRWLSDANKRRCTIAEVAEVVGFRSGAQLSRTSSPVLAARPGS